MGRKGQAAIEFIVVVVVIFFFLFLLFSLAMLFAISSYMDYATFMAARTYKTGAFKESSQFRNAQTVFNSYFDKVSGLARKPSLEIVRTDPTSVRTEGLLASYDVDLFYLPPVFMGSNTPGSVLRLNTEAHLGRDPSFEECQNFFTSFAAKFGVSSDYAELMEDNGC